jgi:hypothetical protein
VLHDAPLHGRKARQHALQVFEPHVGEQRVGRGVHAVRGDREGLDEAAGAHETRTIAGTVPAAKSPRR